MLFFFSLVDDLRAFLVSSKYIVAASCIQLQQDTTFNLWWHQESSSLVIRFDSCYWCIYPKDSKGGIMTKQTPIIRVKYAREDRMLGNMTTATAKMRKLEYGHKSAIEENGANGVLVNGD